MKSDNEQKSVEGELFLNNKCNNIQDVFDKLYDDSLNNKVFTNLMDIILSDDNILLAYNTIRCAFGADIPGKDGLTISDLKKLSFEDICKKIRFLIIDNPRGYFSRPVIKTTISKLCAIDSNFGIPCIWDRLIQQCIKQVITPICEAKFSNSSYGYRSDFTIENSIAACYRYLQIQKLYYVVEIDIESLSETINHSKLIKKIWGLGIQDKTLLYIIKQMLHTQIETSDRRMDKPTKGVLQCGIISNLLTNIYVNEFDKWIDSQWKNHPVANQNARDRNFEGKGIDKTNIYTRMRKTNLKEIFFVRYMNTIRLFTRTYEDAIRILKASIDFLNKRLQIQICKDNTRIVNTKTKYFNYLNFKIRVHNKGNKYVVESHINDVEYNRIYKLLKTQVKNIVKPRTPEYNLLSEIRLYNSMIIRIQNYYRYATHIEIDFDKINWNLLKSLKNRTSKESGGRLKKYGRPLSSFEIKRFGKCKSFVYISCGKWNEPIYPLHYIKTKYPLCKSSIINSYTKEGRLKTKNKKEITLPLLSTLMKEKSFNRSDELLNNRFLKYLDQNGKCAISNICFTNTNQIHCHHIIPVSQGGTDEYNNLILIEDMIHILIHSKEIDVINKYIKIISPSDEMISTINYYRKKVGNKEI